jgi:hypothetical protein
MKGKKGRYCRGLRSLGNGGGASGPVEEYAGQRGAGSEPELSGVTQGDRAPAPVLLSYWGSSFPQACPPFGAGNVSDRLQVRRLDCGTTSRGGSRLGFRWGPLGPVGPVGHGAPVLLLVGTVGAPWACVNVDVEIYGSTPQNAPAAR